MRSLLRIKPCLSFLLVSLLAFVVAGISGCSGGGSSSSSGADSICGRLVIQLPKAKVLKSGAAKSKAQGSTSNSVNHKDADGNNADEPAGYGAGEPDGDVSGDDYPSGETPYINRIDADFFLINEDGAVGTKVLSQSQKIVPEQSEVSFEGIPAPQDYLIKLGIYFSDSDVVCYTPSFRASVLPGETALASRIPPELSGLIITSPQDSLDIGESVMLTLSGYYDDGTMPDVGAAEWTVSDEAVASLSALEGYPEQRLLCGLSAGTVTISAMLENMTAELELTVEAAPEPTPTPSPTSSPEPTPTASPSPTPEPTPSPSPTSKLSFYLTDAYNLGVSAAEDLGSYNYRASLCYELNGKEGSADAELTYTDDGFDADNKRATWMIEASLPASAEGLKLKSLRLAAQESDAYCDFEWWDDAKGVVITHGDSLSVLDNEFAGGAGSDDDPYLVANPRHLNNVRNYLDLDLELSFTQINDIDLGSACGMKGTVNAEDGTAEFTTTFSRAPYYNDGAGWEPIGTKEFAFTGTYDGKNLKICGLAINCKNDNNCYIAVGLFGYAEHAVLKNIDIDEIGCVYLMTSAVAEENDTDYPVYGARAGAVAGFIGDQSIVDSCINRSQVAVYNTAEGHLLLSVGGIVGKGCRNNTISHCSNHGEVMAFYMFNNAVIYSDNPGPGCAGIVGSLLAETSTNKDAINTVVYCENRGNVYSVSQHSKPISGGIIAVSLGVPITCHNCFNYSDVRAFSTCNHGSTGLLDCAFSSGIFLWYELDGWTADNVIYNCGNYGNITSAGVKSYSGGITAGSPDMRTKNKSINIRNCFNVGSITATNNSKASTDSYKYAGGIAGSICREKISYCFNVGPVSANTVSSYDPCVGGICGKLTNSMNSCAYTYNSGTLEAKKSGVSDTKYLGGCIGYKASGTVGNANYYLSGTASKGIGNGSGTVTSVTADQLKNADYVTEAKYLWQLLGGTEHGWKINDKADDELGPGILRGYPVFDWQEVPSY